MRPSQVAAAAIDRCWTAPAHVQPTPTTVVEALRRQAADSLRVAQATSDPAVRNELLAAAAWLHE
jgi:hypothetical protein